MRIGSTNSVSDQSQQAASMLPSQTTEPSVLVSDILKEIYGEGSTHVHQLLGMLSCGSQFLPIVFDQIQNIVI